MESMIVANCYNIYSCLILFQVIKAAQCGYTAVGYELNAWLVLYSKVRP